MLLVFYSYSQYSFTNAYICTFEFCSVCLFACNSNSITTHTHTHTQSPMAIHLMVIGFYTMCRRAYTHMCSFTFVQIHTSQMTCCVHTNEGPSQKTVASALSLKAHILRTESHVRKSLTQSCPTNFLRMISLDKPDM